MNRPDSTFRSYWVRWFGWSKSTRRSTTMLRMKRRTMMKGETLSRRAMLRNVLAVGCSLLLPGALAGCNSKQEAASNSEPPVTPPATSPEPSSAPATPGKTAQAKVQYQTHPKGDRKCSGCLHFIAESNTCELVEGSISPEGWCLLWTQKA
jgi:hypothetical protein